MYKSLNQYYIFYTVAQCNNFSLAAKKLFITQPAVSKAVSKLESDLNTTLFYRSSKGVKLTDAGQILYEQLDAAFLAIKNGEEQITNYEQSGSGQLSIGASTTLCKYVLLPYLRRFIAENPHVKIRISCQSSYETIEALKKGTLDIGLVGETDRLKELKFKPILSISDVFVGTSQYLDLFKDKESDELFSDATLLLLDKSNVTRQYVDKFLILNHIISGQTIEVSSMDLLIDFVKTGLGIGCVIKEFVEKELAEGSLTLIETKEKIPARKIGYAYSSIRKVNRTVTRFLNGLESK